MKMAPIEQTVNINGYMWTQVPSDSTQACRVYTEEQVRRAGGDPAKLVGVVDTTQIQNRK